MNEKEYSSLIKKALGNDDFWATLTATEGGREEAAEWLKDAVVRVRSDRKRKKAEWDAESWQYRKGSPKWREAHAAYKGWLARSHGFETAVVSRLAELGLNNQGHPFKGGPQAKAAAVAKPEDLVRAHNHAEYLYSRLRLTTESLMDLALAVQGFASGSRTLNELTSLLDDLTMPDGQGESPLRAVIESRNSAQTDQGETE